MLEQFEILKELDRIIADCEKAQHMIDEARLAFPGNADFQNELAARQHELDMQLLKIRNIQFYVSDLYR